MVAEIIQDECAAVIQSTRDRAKRPALANTYGFHKMQEICRAAEHCVLLGYDIASMGNKIMMF